jgi:phospholipid/cholesterol/gamma-HCH transport system ATP-binding protein
VAGRATDRQVLVEVDHLVVRFGEDLVLDGIDLEVRQGEILGIVGASGSGKSVLLKTILGLVQPSDGTVRVFGEEMRHLEHEDLHRLRRRWGVVFQSDGLFSGLTVERNIERVLAEHVRLPGWLTREIALLQLGLVGLAPETRNDYPAILSGGMRKKAALARAMALEPDILFLDEPTSGLDPLAAAGFDELIRELRGVLGVTVVLVTHDLHTVYGVCDRIGVIAEHRLVATGPMDEVQHNPHPFIEEFFRGHRGRAAALASERAGGR